MKQFQDIRQSENWGRYLTSLGWKIKDTPGGVMAAIRNLGVGSFIKIQRPHLLSDLDIKEIDELCKNERPLFIKIEPWMSQDEEVLKRNGYEACLIPLSVPSTMYIDLEKTGAELWNNVSHSGKYSINRANREGAEVEFFQNPEEEKLRIFYLMHRKTAKKHGFYTISFKEVLSRSRSFANESYLVLAYDGKNNIASGKLFLGYKDMVIYSMGATSKIGRGDKVGYKLLWESILYFKRLGYKILDLEGVSDKRFPFLTGKWGGFSYFKEKFGGEVIRFPPPYIKYPNLFFRFVGKLFPGAF